MSDNRNRLNRSQAFALTKWLEQNLPEFAENSVTSSQAAERAATALRFAVTPENIKSIAGSGKECILPHKWPGVLHAGERTPDGDRKLSLIVQVVNRLVASQAVDLGDLLPLWEQLVEKSQVPSGTAEPEQE